MIRFFFVLLSFLLAFNSQAQEVSYTEYHRSCRQAEKYFLEDDTTKCLETYLDVFDSFDFLFPRDCFMAAQIAHKLNHDSLAVEFILKGIPFGIRYEFFSVSDSNYTSYAIENLAKTTYWNKVLDQNDSLREIYHQRVNFELKKELDSLLVADQKLNRKRNRWFNRKFRPSVERRFDIQNREHIRYLDSVFQVHGYPGIWLVGVQDSVRSETKIWKYQNRNLSEYTRIIIFHNDSVWLNYGDFLTEELHKGHIDVRTYAMIRDFNDRHLVKRDADEKMYYNIWWQRDNFTKEEFEAHCDEIGVPTKDHLRVLSAKLGNGYDIFWSPYR